MKTVYVNEIDGTLAVITANPAKPNVYAVAFVDTDAGKTVDRIVGVDEETATRKAKEFVGEITRAIGWIPV